MSHNQPTVPAITPERATRLIKAYACRTARIMASRRLAPDTAAHLIDQARRQLGVRLWADVDAIDFEQLADKIAELREARAADWTDQWDSPADKDGWVEALRGMIRAETGALAATLAHRAA